MTEELDRWPAVFRKVEPLPGGLAALRDEIRGTPRRRHRAVAMLGLATAIAAAVIIVVAANPARHGDADRSAMRRLLSDGALPDPGAVALGLVAPAELATVRDPRVDDGVVVFRWVEPSAQ